MLKPCFQKQFRKSVKRSKKRGKDMDKLKEVMSLLINEEPLDQKYRNHSLSGNYIGCFECHIEPDWLLIYLVDKVEKSITFINTGTHSDLFNE